MLRQNNKMKDIKGSIFKNCARFFNYNSEIINTEIHNAKYY